MVSAPNDCFGSSLCENLSDPHIPPFFIRHSRAEACASTLETREPSRPNLDASP
jgi:hypothetical protein